MLEKIDMQNETWKDISDFVGFYQISDMGRIKSLSRKVKTGRSLLRIAVIPERIMSINLSKKDGYCRIVLKKGTVKKGFSVHRLVATHFIENPNNFPEVNHKKGCKTDNRASELEWVSIHDNNQHSWDNKLSKGNTGKFGRDHGRSKRIRQLKDGNVIAEYFGAREAERLTGYSNTNICTALKTNKPYNGFIWEYVK